MSSGCPTRCMGMSRAIAAWRSGLWACPPPMLVMKNPGAIALTVMPDAASSSAAAAHEVRRPGLRGHVRRADRRLDLRRGQRGGDDDPPEAARTHVPGRGPRGGEDAVEVDVDHAVPARVRVDLERAVLHPRALPAGPCSDEPDARIDARVGERDVETAVLRGGLVDRAVERGVVGHVGDGPANVEPLTLRRSASRPPLRVDVDQRHPRPVGGQHLAVGEPEPAGAAGDDHAVAGDVELRGNVHAHCLLELVGDDDPIATSAAGSSASDSISELRLRDLGPRRVDEPPRPAPNEHRDETGCRCRNDVVVDAITDVRDLLGLEPQLPTTRSKNRGSGFSTPQLSELVMRSKGSSHRARNPSVAAGWLAATARTYPSARSSLETGSHIRVEIAFVVVEELRLRRAPSLRGSRRTPVGGADDARSPRRARRRRPPWTPRARQPGAPTFGSRRRASRRHRRRPRERSQQRFDPGEVVAGRHLEQRRVPLDDRHAPTARARRARRSPSRRRDHRHMRRAAARRRRPGVSARRPAPARSSVSTTCPPSTRFTVSCSGSPGTAPAAPSASPPSTRSITASRDERPGGIVDEDRPAPRRGPPRARPRPSPPWSRPRSRRRRPSTRRAPRPAGSSAPPIRVARRRRSRRSSRTHPAARGSPRGAADHRARANALGRSEPRRSPVAGGDQDTPGRSDTGAARRGRSRPESIDPPAGTRPMGQGSLALASCLGQSA